jgi:anti-anti-sigma factor
MGLQILARQSGDVTILDLHGRILIGDSNDSLAAALSGLMQRSQSAILINLADVPQIDSSGISTLVRTFVTLGRQGGILKLLNPVGRVKEVLELTRLIKAIPTFTDEPMAITSFRGAARASGSN